MPDFHHLRAVCSGSGTLMRISKLVVPAWSNCMSMWDSIIKYPRMAGMPFKPTFQGHGVVQELWRIQRTQFSSHVCTPVMCRSVIIEGNCNAKCKMQPRRAHFCTTLACICRSSENLMLQYLDELLTRNELVDNWYVGQFQWHLSYIGVWTHNFGRSGY